MILAHTIVGLMPVDNSQFSWYWFVGSVIPDIDHLFVIYKHKLFSWKKLVEVERFEDKYNIHFKTKYGHSVFGATVTTIPLLFFNTQGALFFFLAYILHLLLDWPDIDEKQYLFPFKKKFRIFLPIFSKLEIIFTIILLGCFVYTTL